MASLAAEVCTYKSRNGQVRKGYISFQPFSLMPTPATAEENTIWKDLLETQLDDIDKELSILKTDWYASLPSGVRGRVSEHAFRGFINRTQASSSEARASLQHRFKRNMAKLEVSFLVFISNDLWPRLLSSPSTAVLLVLRVMMISAIAAA